MLSENYRPTTFLERGVAIPFTTPALQYARARPSERDEFELLIGGFTGDRTIYVLPFKALPETFTLTVHDRALSEDIVVNHVRTPHSMRLAAYRVALTGLAGASARTAARQGLDAEKDGELLTQYLLTSRVLEMSGLTPQQVAQLVAGGKNDARIRREIKSAAIKIGTDPEKLNPLIDETARFSYTIGLPTAPVPGPVRRLFVKLKRFDEHLEHFIETSKSERNTTAQFIRDTLAITLSLAETAVANIDKRLTKIDKDTFMPVSVRALKADCERVSWLLDGWEDIVAIYYGDHPDTKHPPNNHVMRILDPLFIKLPLIPTKEVSADNDVLKEAPVSNRRSVRMGQDWRSGEMDLETMLRIEKLRTRVLQATKPEKGAGGGD